MEEKIDGCVQLDHTDHLFCKDCSVAPARSDNCNAFRAIQLRVMFEDDRQ